VLAALAGLALALDSLGRRVDVGGTLAAAVAGWLATPFPG